MADPRDVTPDSCLLKQIFPATQPENITILVQTWHKCVFKVEFTKSADDVYPACVVRIEAENAKDIPKFTTTAALQQIAASVIPNLVPQTFQIGKAKNAHGKSFHFSVVELVEGELLEDVWERMRVEEQEFVVNELIEALAKLHSVRMCDEVAQKITSKIFRNGDDVFLKGHAKPGAFGGPNTGFLADGPALLDAIMAGRKLRKPFCTMSSIPDSQDISIRSNYEELGSMIIDRFDIDKWLTEAVLCHNDLNPRNLILRSVHSSDGKFKYTLAGIIDWELAGFYPPSYELSLQDTYLGCANRHVTFYMMLKERMTHLVPRSSSQMVLLQATELIFRSQQRFLSDGNNIGARMRKRFMERTKMIRDKDLYVGWTRDFQDGVFHDYSAADFQKLEDELVEEIYGSQKAS